MDKSKETIAQHKEFVEETGYVTVAERKIEWEYAARGGRENAVFKCDNDNEKLPEMANTWTGEFPTTNSLADGFEGAAPVKSFPPNKSGCTIWQEMFGSSQKIGITRSILKHL